MKNIKMDTFKLDNPAWYSLNEAHEEFAVNYDGLKFYQPAYCPFGGVFTDKSVALNIADYASFTDYFFLIGDEPKIDQNVKIDGELVCNQMILEKPIDLESNTSKIPYLDVASDNANAIRLYQKLGFVSRRKLSFWKMSRVLR